LLVAIAAQHGADLYGTDTKQAFLYGDKAVDEDFYVKQPEWWFDPIPEGHVFRLRKAIYWTKRAARRWHTRISTWMEENGYPAVNSGKTIFMKRTGDDFIIHGLFVDDIKSIPTKKALLYEFIAKYSKEFDITGGQLMTRFLGLSVEQDNHSPSVHLDQYIKETIEEYRKFTSKALRPKMTPMQPGNVLEPEETPLVPDPKKQSIHRLIVARLQYAATWVRLDISNTVAQLARFCASAGPKHWAALHHVRVIKYLSKHPSLKLEYRRITSTPKGLEGYCYADWGNRYGRECGS
jgi:hypothetical protein